ncbi:MAG: hypothetical protein LAKADJCE_00968 [Candidatus Argoarchaeum ethanivorans]|uniref:Uncharacterized protein n=1 Tax=Candidatus Argoarchaeum ethanivorans TaxID=2608793 RepID=A0A811TG21_9EURY|nr:MAG: hypothetical protein LAKADJCE_00968 [Candidatus Argoarchaeum ethanivorans]
MALETARGTQLSLSMPEECSLVVRILEKFPLIQEL